MLLYFPILDVDSTTSLASISLLISRYLGHIWIFQRHYKWLVRRNLAAAQKFGILFKINITSVQDLNVTVRNMLFVEVIILHSLAGNARKVVLILVDESLGVACANQRCLVRIILVKASRRNTTFESHSRGRYVLARMALPIKTVHRFWCLGSDTIHVGDHQIVYVLGAFGNSVLHV